MLVSDERQPFSQDHGPDRFVRARSSNYLTHSFTRMRRTASQMGGHFAFGTRP